MREYDNVDYRYNSSNGESEKAIKIVSGILGFSPDTSSLEYDLGFFSGGIGVDDNLAFSCSMSREKIENVVKKLSLVSPVDALKDQAWNEDFTWLVKHEENASSIRLSSANFINKMRKPFQNPCAEEHAVFFAQESNVNTWTAVWITEGKLNYLYSDQG